MNYYGVLPPFETITVDIYGKIKIEMDSKYGVVKSFQKNWISFQILNII